MSTKPKPESTANMQFVGAAQTVSPSFFDLAFESLNQYCPKWNYLSDGASYIFPPTFTFKNADKSDEDIDLVKTELDEKKKDGAAQKVLSTIERPVIDRQSDDAEFLVFQAIWKLVQEKIQAPFLAVHNLNLGSDMQYHLQTIFPNAPCVIQEKFKDMMREYDFVLIGPKIGIIVIEVKSSFFTKQKDFGANNSRWPDQIVKGVEQLNSFDLEFFKDCSGIRAPLGLKTRKILFTPNLEKARLEAWLNNMDDLGKENAQNFLASSGITHWLKEELKNTSRSGITNCFKGFSESIRDSLKPALYSTIRQMLEEPGFQIPLEIYESYGLIISGLSSAVIQENQPSVCIERISTSAAILSDAAKLDTHDPLQKLQQLSLSSTKPKAKKRKTDINPNNVIEINSKLILLTPDQRAALNGPDRQLIIGVPGTGKTIILQEKARQLLKDGKNILVLASPSYLKKFQKFFDNYACGKFVIRNNAFGGDFRLFLYLMNCINDLVARKKPLQKTLDTLSEYTENVPEMRDWLTNFDAILVDDAFDVHDCHLLDGTFENIKRLLFVMLLFILARSCEFSSKVVWVAGDACSINSLFSPILDQIFKDQQEDYFACVVFHRVMRSSMSVIKATYCQDIWPDLAIKPSIGHNVHGFSESVHLKMRSLSELKIWRQIERAVKKFRDEGFDYGHMAVILGGTRKERNHMNLIRTYFEREFCKLFIPVDLASSHSLSSLTLDTFDQVSSLEWPVVVFVAMVDSDDKGFYAGYYRYRACSRATMELFEIIADWRDISDYFRFGPDSPRGLFKARSPT